MMTSIWGIIKGGRIEPSEPIQASDGTRVLVTIVGAENDNDYWVRAAQSSLAAIWDNDEDDIYGELLAR